MNRKGAKSHRRKGAVGEEVAINFLEKNGYQILERNYYYNHGEIDVIAKEGKALVFVEVKSRRSRTFGEPEESVTPKKQELIRRTAEGYVLEKNIGEMDCRFDVVSVVLTDGKAECAIFKDCF